MDVTDAPSALERFVVAQNLVYASVLDELRMGHKRTHWMWFVFPQLRGLGSSVRAHTYGIESLGEARAYLEHPLLGSRLQTCTSLVLATRDRTVREIFGEPDDMKFCSSMTLFCAASSEPENIFRRALERYCGTSDPRTLELLRKWGASP